MAASMVTRSSAASTRDNRDLRVNDRLAIPRDELVVRATRASGAGGQHVNKTSTRVEITWNVVASQALDDADRARISARLSSRLSDDGELRVVASDTRSQLQSREAGKARRQTQDIREETSPSKQHRRVTTSPA